MNEQVYYIEQYGYKSDDLTFYFTLPIDDEDFFNKGLLDTKSSENLKTISYFRIKLKDKK